MPTERYPIRAFLICLSLAACQPTVSGLKPVPQPSVSASTAPNSVETPKPTIKTSSLPSPLPPEKVIEISPGLNRVLASNLDKVSGPIRFSKIMNNGSGAVAWINQGNISGRTLNQAKVHRIFSGGSEGISTNIHISVNENNQGFITGNTSRGTIELGILPVITTSFTMPLLSDGTLGEPSKEAGIWIHQTVIDENYRYFSSCKRYKCSMV